MTSRKKEVYGWKSKKQKLSLKLFVFFKLIS